MYVICSLGVMCWSNCLLLFVVRVCVCVCVCVCACVCVCVCVSFVPFTIDTRVILSFYG